MKAILSEKCLTPCRQSKNEEHVPNEIDATMQRATLFLEGRTSDAKDVLAWRKQLRTHGQPVLARALSRILAEQFIQGTALTEDEVDDLWKACKTDEAFSQARRVLKRRRASAANILPARPGSPPPPTAQKLREQAALMTSKDPDLAASVRHDWALQILEPDLHASTAETLGIAGGRRGCLPR